MVKRRWRENANNDEGNVITDKARDGTMKKYCIRLQYTHVNK